MPNKRVQEWGHRNETVEPRCTPQLVIKSNQTCTPCTAIGPFIFHVACGNHTINRCQRDKFDHMSISSGPVSVRVCVCVTCMQQHGRRASQPPKSRAHAIIIIIIGGSSSIINTTNASGGLAQRCGLPYAGDHAAARLLACVCVHQTLLK